MIFLKTVKEGRKGGTKGKKKLQRENRGNVVDLTQTRAITILKVSGPVKCDE